MTGKLSTGCPVQLPGGEYEETSAYCSRGRGFDGRGDNTF
jgi:hypothetical protein